MILPDDIAQTTIALKDQFLDLRGLSAYSSLAVPTLRDYLKVARNPLPFYKLKGKILVKRSEFDNWMEGKKVNRKQNIKTMVDDIMTGLKRGKSDG